MGVKSWAYTFLVAYLKYWFIGGNEDHASGSYVGLALWMWFLVERLKAIMEHWLHYPTGM